jgi:hypothetical protein
MHVGRLIKTLSLMGKMSESVARRNGKWLWKHCLLSSYLRRELILVDTKRM